jgi:membrane protease YdiL (CAAX protease family)
VTLNQTVKRINLIILSILAIAFIGLSLAESANSPQAQTRLDLMQTDLILEVSAWQPQEQEMTTLRNVLVGNDPKGIYTQAIASYREALNSNQALLGATQKSEQISQNINDLSLRLGILYAKVNKIPEAIASWQKVSFQDSNTAQVLRGLWSQPALIFPDAEIQIRSSLNGWFGNQALEQLFIAQERWGAIDSLATIREYDAERAIEKLILTSSITVVGGGLGVVGIIILATQRLFFAKSSPLQPNPDLNWTTPWQLQKAWEVMVLWFIAYVAVSQIFLPTALYLLSIYPDATWNSRDRAILILIPYIASMAPMLLIFRTTLREFLPFPSYIFNFKFWTWTWLGWGLGGYIVAIPIVLIVSALNQQLLGGQGGGNPLLPILAADQNDIAKLLLWMTVAIAAPLFEELLFRGFLLPSLISGFTKRLPQSFSSVSTWLGIGTSGLFFAIAHLNLADILPLTALGMVLGFVYVRSQNLLAPMLLHGLWNSGTFLTLLVLGSSGS